MPTDDGPFHADADGVQVRLRVTPKAGRAAVDGVIIDADGHAQLRVRVTAAADGGKANAAVIKLLAKHWRLPARCLTLIGGTKDRRKRVRVAGDPKRLLQIMRRDLDRDGP